MAASVHRPGAGRRFTEMSMRGFKVMLVVAVVCCAARAEASMPHCLQWGWVANDAGTLADGGQVLIVDDEDAGAVDGVRVPPPPTGHRVCTRFGYTDEGGCSIGGGVPAVGAALAALVLVARRARRKVH